MPALAKANGSPVIFVATLVVTAALKPKKIEKIIAWRIESAMRGTGPKYMANQDVWLAKNVNPTTNPTRAAGQNLRPRADRYISASIGNMSPQMPRLGNTK
jgi:hypothetical protein